MPKPILGMLHLGGETSARRIEIARQELAILVANGVDGVVIENYFGEKDDVRAVLASLGNERPPILIGINVLRDFQMAFDLDTLFHVDFIQIDSVAGHLSPDEDRVFASDLAALRAKSRAAVLGGVRFKYQPVKSGRSEEMDLRIGMERCDAIVVTGNATGVPTDLAKVARFRAVTGSEYPLFIGAGMTAANAMEQLAATDGAVVGSYFKDTREAKGAMYGPHVAEIMNIARGARAVSARVE